MSAMRTVENRCEMITTVLFSVSCANRSYKAASPNASKAAVGSSKKRIWDSLMKARDRVLPIYENLAKVLDEDLVARRVTRPPNSLARRLALERNDEALRPGQKAPAFALPALDGTQVALNDVLERKELVMVEFWASWCSPCIATFPHLKRLHAAFNDKGFEIIVISIDDTFEEWEQASEEQQLPRLNVADIGGFQMQTPIAYGVSFIPKAYLIDAEGCILQKDLETDKIQEVLVARYGDSPELHVADAESNPMESAVGGDGGGLDG